MKDKTKGRGSRGLKLGTLCLLFLFAASCTNVEQWDITTDPNASKHLVEDASAYTEIVEFGDNASSEVGIDYSTWTYDPASLYKDPALEAAQFSGFALAQMHEKIPVEGRGLEVVIDKIEPFDDELGTGKHGIAVIYTVKNNSTVPIFFAGLTENIVPFALFAPDGTSLKTHYNLQSAPPAADQEYPERIVFPKKIHTPSMIATELPSGESVTMYRMYDFAGIGEYTLYTCTDKVGVITNKAVGIKFTL